MPLVSVLPELRGRRTLRLTVLLRKARPNLSNLCGAEGSHLRGRPRPDAASAGTAAAPAAPTASGAAGLVGVVSSSPTGLSTVLETPAAAMAGKSGGSPPHALATAPTAAA